MPRVAPAISLNPTTKATLDRLARSAPQNLALRSRIVLAAAAGRSNQQIADELQLPEVTVSKGPRRNKLYNLSALRKERVVPVGMEGSWLEVEFRQF